MEEDGLKLELADEIMTVATDTLHGVATETTANVVGQTLETPRLETGITGDVDFERGAVSIKEAR